MDLGLAGEVAMVAAGARGAGLAVAEALAREGALVSLCGEDSGPLEEARSRLGPSHRAFRCDVSERAELEFWLSATARELGAPTILVTDLGAPPAAPAGPLTAALWREGFEHAVLDLARIVDLVAPEMAAAGRGRVVHLAALRAPDAALATTFRAGITAMSRLQARDLAVHGIAVNCVVPGRAEEEAGRRGRTPQEVADVVAFLCSERAGHVTGSRVLIDGAPAFGTA